MTEAAFIDAILKEPNEPIHRMAYADWLDELGDPRAEFLRLQILLNGPSTKGIPRAQAERFRELKGSLDPHWIELMTHRQNEAEKGEKRRSRRERLEADLSLFVQQYGRRGHNDRHYDRRVEDAVKRMKPEDLDRLLRGDDD